MEKEEIRFRILGLAFPVVGLSIALFCIYSALDWLVLTPRNWLDDDVTRYWLPLTLAVFVYLVFVMPRISAFKLASRNKPFVYYTVALAVIAAPVMMMQAYIGPARGQITRVYDAAELASAPSTKYYSADKICLDAANAVAHYALEASGQRDGSLELVLYGIAPVCVPPLDIAGMLGTGAPRTPGAGSLDQLLHPEKSTETAPIIPGVPHVWIAMTFSRRIDGNADRAARLAAANELGKDAQRKLVALDPRKYKYFERIGSKTAQRNFVAALSDHGKSLSKGDLILMPHEDEFGRRSGDWLTWSLLALGGGALLWTVMAMVTTLKDDALSARIANSGWLIPSRTSYGLQILVAINASVFLAMVMAGFGFLAFDNADLVAWGANYGPDLQGLGYLRLITSTFVHGGIMHLANNMYGLVIAGVFLGTVLPNWRLIGCYLICGLGGSLASAALHPDVISVGASGAILGLWGVLIALAVLKDPRAADGGRKVLLLNGLMFAGLTIFMGSVTPGIDNAAHIGGLITGFLLGVIMRILAKRDESLA